MYLLIWEESLIGNESKTAVTKKISVKMGKRIFKTVY